jgi:4'-phosphopantetheinyl transferase
MAGAEDAIEVVVTALNGRAAAACDSAAKLLSEGERQRAARFARERDRRRYIVARAELRRLLGARLHERPEAIEFVYGRRGKPALAPRFAASGLRFNLSHCEDVAVYAFARAREVGVDVEVVRPLPDADGIAARFFSRNENLAYLALASADRSQGFFNCWTRKEAFIKALGGGLHIPLRRFEVSLAPGEPARLLRVGRRPGDRCGWRLIGLQPAPGLTGAVVVRAPPPSGPGTMH